MIISFSCKNEHAGVETEFKDVAELLGSLADSGWPICGDCGDDMEFEVVSDDSTMETKHTLGPWSVGNDEGDGTPVVTFEARDICRLETHYSDAEANAQLIAAAPDLLGHLHDLLGCCELNMDDMEPESCELITEANKYIAKFE